MRDLAYRFKIGTKLSFLAALGVALTLVITVVSYSSISNLRDNNRLATDQGLARTNLADTQAQVNNVQMMLSALSTVPASIQKQITDGLPATFTLIDKDIKSVDDLHLADVDTSALHTALDAWKPGVTTMANAYISKTKYNLATATAQYNQSTAVNNSVTKLRNVLTKFCCCREVGEQRGQQRAAHPVDHAARGCCSARRHLPLDPPLHRRAAAGLGLRAAVGGQA